MELPTELTARKEIQILLEIIESREYTFIEYNEQKLVFSYKDKHIWIFTDIMLKLNSQEIKSKISLLLENKIPHAILLCKGLATPAVKECIINAVNIGLFIELKYIEDVYYNPLKSNLVPRHIRLSEEESNEIKATYGIKIPVLLRTDVISKWYNFQKGDIIKIIRPDAVMYRIVK